jgi:hypothetical protein
LAEYNAKGWYYIWKVDEEAEPMFERAVALNMLWEILVSVISSEVGPSDSSINRIR